MRLADYVENKPVLTTPNLTLRVMVPEDVPALKEWMGLPEIYTYWGKGPSKAEKSPSLLFEKPERKTKSLHWGILHHTDNKIIGEFWVYLIENDRMAKVAFRLNPAYQGHGYMTEVLQAVVEFCFTKTELKRLWTDVHVDNHASYKTLEKSGFVREGHIHQGKMVNTYCDYYLYGLVKN